MRAIMMRTLAGFASVCLLGLTAWSSLLVVLFAPLEAPDADYACADPCFGPLSDYGEVLMGAVGTAATAALSGVLAAAAFATFVVAAGRPLPSMKWFARFPVAAAALALGVVATAQAIAAI